MGEIAVLQDRPSTCRIRNNNAFGPLAMASPWQAPRRTEVHPVSQLHLGPQLWQLTGDAGATNETSWDSLRARVADSLAASRRNCMTLHCWDGALRSMGPKVHTLVSLNPLLVHSVQ